MKNSGKCFKCGSDDLLRIPGWVGRYGAGNNIPTGFTIFGAVKVTRFLCCGCGYSEEWVEWPDDIEKLRKEYPSIHYKETLPPGLVASSSVELPPLPRCSVCDTPLIDFGRGAVFPLCSPHAGQ